MMEKVKLTQEQADAIETLKEKAKDMLVVDLLEALINGYEVEEEYNVGEWAKFKQFGDEWIAIIAEDSDVKGRYLPDFDIHAGQNERFYEVSKPTPEEIKAEQERRVWKSIGREVGEFKANDVFIDKKGMPFIFASVTHLSSGIITLKTAYEWHRIGNFKGLYPAESFVELSGESHDN